MESNLKIGMFFNIWKNKVIAIRYNKWCEINNDLLEDNEYAEQSGMSSDYWCWNCKYSDCELHNY